MILSYRDARSQAFADGRFVREFQASPDKPIAASKSSARRPVWMSCARYEAIVSKP